MLNRPIDTTIAHEIEALRRSSWSVEGEDIVCKFLLEHLITHTGMEKGIVLDIGAHHPYRFSNTYLMYQSGWRGINIEPNPDFIPLFEKIRPEDVTLNVGMSDESGAMSYRRFEEPVLNGFFTDDEVKQKPGYIDQVDVKILGVKDFLSNYVGDNKIDFMNLDVEGLEVKILGSWDWHAHRPKLICVEIHGYDIEAIQNHAVHRLLKSRGYSFLSRIWQSSMYADPTSFYRQI